MIIPMLCVTIFVIVVVWFLLPRVARLMIHTPTAISIFVCLSFFFQAEDGIRDLTVTGVQTCALPISSSCSVYGASNHDLLTERSRLNPVSLYARTRVLSENLLFDRAGDVEPVVLRLATVFGLSPRMRFDLVVNTLTVKGVVDGKIPIQGGNQWRPNVHCRDAARAFIAALEAPADRVAGEVFNVGGDALNHRIADLGEMVARIIPGVEIVRQPDVADPRDYRVGFEKIRTVLAFEPEFTVAER